MWFTVPMFQLQQWRMNFVKVDANWLPAYFNKPALIIRKASHYHIILYNIDQFILLTNR